MRKGYTQFTKADFDEFPVWELQHSLTTVKPYDGEIPFKIDRMRAFFVRTAFTLADGTKMPGWTMINIPPYKIDMITPTILTENGRVDLTKLSAHPKQKDIDAAVQWIGKPLDKIFPLRFQTEIPIPDGPATGTMTGFVHYIVYREDEDKIWTKQLEFIYQTAAELDRQIKEFEQKRAAEKAALEPTPEEEKLLKAAKAGNVAKVKASLEKGARVNCGGKFEANRYKTKKVTPLMFAAEAGHMEVIQALLQAGADIHLADDSSEPWQGGKTALAYACRKNQVAAARALLDAGSDPHKTLSVGQTILDEACNASNLEIIELLLARRADPNESCGKTNLFALNRAVTANRLEVMQLLLKHKANINADDGNGNTALMNAAKLIRADVVKFLIENGANVSLQTVVKSTALHEVVETAGRLDPSDGPDAVQKFADAVVIVKQLVEHGADLNVATKFASDTPLSLAKKCKLPELADYLASKGAM